MQQRIVSVRYININTGDIFCDQIVEHQKACFHPTVVSNAVEGNMQNSLLRPALKIGFQCMKLTHTRYKKLYLTSICMRIASRM